MAYIYVMHPDNNIRIWRRKAGLNQTELAKAIGMHQTHFSKLENGQRQLTLAWARRIARVLGCSVADLLSDEDNPMRLSDGERTLVETYRSASADQRETIRRVTEAVVPYRAMPDQDDRAA